MAKIAEHYVRIGANIDDLTGNLNKAKSSLKNFAGQVAKIGSAFGVAFGVAEIGQFLNESRKLAAEAEGVRAAFERIGGQSIFQQITEATKGTVSQLDLMKNAVMAKNFDIPLKDISALFAFATKRAQETGQSVKCLTDSIILGIGRKSPLILDNLGISAVRLRQELKGVGSEAASVADIAAAVGKIASAEMAKSGAIIETAAVKSEQWAARLANIKV